MERDPSFGWYWTRWSLDSVLLAGFLLSLLWLSGNSTLYTSDSWTAWALGNGIAAASMIGSTIVNVRFTFGVWW